MFFFPLACAVYFIVPKKCRVPWLLACSYAFYMSWNVRYALLMAASTLATYLGALAMGEQAQTQQGQAQLSQTIRAEDVPSESSLPGRMQKRKERRIVAQASRRAILIGCIAFNLAILALFKYANMFLACIHSGRTLDLLLPVGISFYTFQALGYLIDVYRGDIAAERNLLRYALFVSFFPQLVAGPIERSRSLLPQVQRAHELKLWDAERVTQGAILMVWGFFLKMVISDRAAIFVDAIWADCGAYSRIVLLLATLAFTLQIYCDFGGYTMIAIGAARILGFRLMENFHAPYFATSIRDFWSRWHISLSTWFRDYLYIPLGGSRRGQARRCVNLLITFLVSGLWHGADWSFVLWGGIHGLGQLAEDLLTRGRALESRIGKLTAFLRWGATLAFVNFAWIFFRAPSIADALEFFRCLARGGGVSDLVLPAEEWVILGCAIAVLLVFDAIRRFVGQMPDQYLMRRKLSTEWAILIALITAIFVFGEYGPTFDPKAFIYFQF